MPGAALAAAAQGLVLGHHEARLRVVLAAAAAHARAFEQQRVGRSHLLEHLHRQSRQLRQQLLPQRIGLPVQRPLRHRFGDSIVPRHFFAPQRQAYSALSFFV
jgi:hypothetical protein